MKQPQTVGASSVTVIAAHYARGMTSIRGRRVQRLIEREFSGADHVLPARLRSGMEAILGLSRSGAALCATDGTGRQASVFKWLHGADEAVEVRFDLYKDSLPVLDTLTVRQHELREKLRLDVTATPRDAPALVADVLEWLR